MIRIKNITRENRALRYKDNRITTSDGNVVKVHTGRELSITHAAFLVNRDKIILPGEKMTNRTVFEVVSGVEEIIPNKSVTEAVVTQPTSSCPDDPNKNNDTTNLLNQEPPTNTTNGTSEVAPAESDDDANTTPRGDEERETGSNDSDNSGVDKGENPEDDGEAGIQPVFTEVQKTRVAKYPLEQLEAMSGKELNELLDKEDIDIPRNTTKQKRINALMKLAW